MSVGGSVDAVARHEGERARVELVARGVLPSADAPGDVRELDRRQVADASAARTSASSTSAVSARGAPSANSNHSRSAPLPLLARRSAAAATRARRRRRRSRAARRHGRGRVCQSRSEAAVNSPRRSSGAASSAGGTPVRPKPMLAEALLDAQLHAVEHELRRVASSSVHVTRPSCTTMRGWRSSQSVTGVVVGGAAGSIAMPADVDAAGFVAPHREPRSIDRRAPRRRRSSSGSEVHDTTRSTRGSSSTAGRRSTRSMTAKPRIDRRGFQPSHPVAMRADGHRLADALAQQRRDVVLVRLDARERDEAHEQQQAQAIATTHHDRVGGEPAAGESAAGAAGRSRARAAERSRGIMKGR